MGAAVEALRLLKAVNNKPVQLRLSLRQEDLLNVLDVVTRVTSLETAHLSKRMQAKNLNSNHRFKDHQTVEAVATTRATIPGVDTRTIVAVLKLKGATLTLVLRAASTKRQTRNRNNKLI